MIHHVISTLFDRFPHVSQAAIRGVFSNRKFDLAGQSSFSNNTVLSCVICLATTLDLSLLEEARLQQEAQLMQGRLNCQQPKEAASAVIFYFSSSKLLKYVIGCCDYFISSSPVCDPRFIFRPGRVWRAVQLDGRIYQAGKLRNSS